MIRFTCENCGQKIKVADTAAGKRGKCPKCAAAIIVPSAPPEAAIKTTHEVAKTPAITEPMFQPPLAPQTAPESPLQPPTINLEDAEKPPQRKFSWLIDIFLYPANIQGLIFLAIAVLVPLVIRAVALFLCVFGLIFSLFNAVIGMYIYWFLDQCVRDSASGGLRAPETIAETPGIWELLWQVFELFACLAICAAPAAVYLGYTRRFDHVFWLLAGGGAFLYPMALLAVIMFDSINGLNPIIIIPSIFSTFFQYCGLVVLIAAIVFLYIQTVNFLPQNLFIRMVLSPLVQAVELYLAMVAAHLLGRFYFKYQEKLNWDV